MKTRCHVLVSGRVQGVFFRSATERLALSLGIGGWVRNLPDGRVEAVFEGERQAVEKAIAFCRRGPQGASVDEVEIRWADPKGEERFEVKG